MAKPPRKPKPKDILRRRKKKVSILTQEKVDYVDWKDINLLRRFMSDRAKIRARLVTGNNQQQQMEVARAIKNAREMALLPYTNRITTQRSISRGREDERFDGPAPVPSEPPPPLSMSDDVDLEASEEALDVKALDVEVTATGGDAAVAVDDSVAEPAAVTAEANPAEASTADQAPAVTAEADAEANAAEEPVR